MGETLGKLFISVNTAWDADMFQPNTSDPSAFNLPGVWQYCTNDTCTRSAEILDGLPDTFSGWGFIHVIFLLVAYAFVLMRGSSMISDGSELLLLVPSLKGIVGSVVLPVLGAVPDGAIVLFSGMGPPDEVQKQLSVGVGGLAGSTILLLTVPWCLSVFAGRVSLDADGKGSYKASPKLTPENSRDLFKTGVECNSIRMTGIIMLWTLLPYLLIQIPAFAADCGKQADETKCQAPEIHWYAFVGMLICLANFVGYLYYQVKTSHTDKTREDKVEQLRTKAIMDGTLNLTGAYGQLLREEGGTEMLSGNAASVALNPKPAHENPKFKKVLKIFFAKYDTDGNGSLDLQEITQVMLDLKEDPAQAKAMLTRMDKDADGNITFDEFCEGIAKLLSEKDPSRNLERAGSAQLRRKSTVKVFEGNVQAQPQKTPLIEVQEPADEDEDEEEDEEIPEDLKDLSEEEQQRRIKQRSFVTMGLGTLLVLLFSDPMVDVLTAIGNATHLGPFYAAFILAPLASNASEIIASYSYALKKTRSTITISLAALQGAACMNNTFCLGIFLALVFFKGLAWEFSAETISIIAVEIVIGLVSFKTTHTLFDGFMVLSMFPLSLVLVWVLENKAGLN